MAAFHEKKLLIIDDDKLFCSAAKEYLSDFPVDIVYANTGKEGLKICDNEKVDVILLDQKLPDTSGSKLYPLILEKNENSKIIFITAFPDLKNAVDAVKGGVHDYLSKPFEPEELSIVVEKAINTIELEKVARAHKYYQSVETVNTNLLGSSDSMINLKKMVKLASGNDAPVIITGETGTGKNLAAKIIHYRGLKKDGPYITVNCAALPENLIEAELFGVEKGAYTGADRSRKGLFELADGGTLLLDEIGELPMHIQSKLLGVLDEKKIKKIGGQKSIDIDVRVIAATNIDIEKAITEKKFRKDLYYRLSIIRIHLDPLRDRKSDIPEIVEHMVKKFSGNKIFTISEDELFKLRVYNWPGNIRELSNIMERAIILNTDLKLYPSDFIKENFTHKDCCESFKIEDSSLKLKDVEKNHILSVLDKNHSNYSKTARALGISRSTLMRKLEAYHLN